MSFYFKSLPKKTPEQMKKHKKHIQDLSKFLYASLDTDKYRKQCEVEGCNNVSPEPLGENVHYECPECLAISKEMQQQVEEEHNAMYPHRANCPCCNGEGCSVCAL